MKYDESGTDGLEVYYLVPGTPLPPGLVESWVWRENLGVVFETKGVISKYCGIRSCEFCVRKVVFFVAWRLIVSIQFSRNPEMVLGQHGKARRFGKCACCPNQGAIVAFAAWGCL